MGYQTISRKFDKKVTTVAVIIWNWKKYIMTISLPQSGAPSKILVHGVEMIMSKVMGQPKTTQEALVNDLNGFGTTVTKNTIGNEWKSCSAYNVRMLEKAPQNDSEKAQENVLSPDETKIELSGMILTRKRNAYDPQSTISTLTRSPCF